MARSTATVAIRYDGTDPATLPELHDAIRDLLTERGMTYDLHVENSASAQLEKIATYLDEWKDGRSDGQELVVDTLTELRKFAAIHAVDFDHALDVSRLHYLHEKPTTKETEGA